MDGSTPKAKSFDISKRLVFEAWEKVQANGGAPGVDAVSITMFKAEETNNLYKVWNRMSAGSYMPGPVRAVEIPKDHGAGIRVLGVPNVVDRIAQTAVAALLEEKLEPIFHPDSYGYRPGRSAHDALVVARKRCWQQDWVLDLDIRAFFDSVPHDLLLKAVARHTDLRWVLLYIERWLTAPMQMPDGTLVAREKGTPQGSPISPLLANLFMHYAFDSWMGRDHPGCPFERYADDIVRHEAPFNRVEMKGLRLWPVAAGHGSWGQPEPGDAGEGGKQPRQRRDGSALPDGLGPASKTRRCNASESVAKPLNRRAGSNLVDMGRSAAHGHCEVIDSEAGQSPRSGGHTESLRRRRGEAAGAQLDTSLVDRLVVNVGTIPASPSPAPSLGGDGQARRRLLASGWDGALVVVGGRESRSHGEGEQRVRSPKCGMPGGRR
jgi:retron-type reverse transcriptase